MTELKACPFCGGEARAMGRDSGFIYCLNDDCGAEVRTPRDCENDDAMAIRMWNTRTPSISGQEVVTEPTEAMIEAVARALVPVLSGSQEDELGRDLPDAQFDDLPPDWQQRHREYARVAIAAMVSAVSLGDLPDE